jgi:hypothetical protein
MHLDPLYRATFTTPESWAVDLEGAGGVEGQLFLIAEGRSEGRLSARLRAANYPRRRTDGTLLPDFRGALATDDGATVLFSWQGYARASDQAARELVGAVMHVTDDARYAWLNTAVCALTGEVRPRADGDGFEVAVEVAEIVGDDRGYSSEQEAAIGSPSREV